MSILIWFLSFILILTCLFLCLLVLVQLPKKEAGLGQAFGSGATDALFGPGSGNMLTKLTKWTSGIFFGLVVSIWILYGHTARAKTGDPRAILSKPEKEALTPPAKPVVATLDTNLTNLSLLTVPKGTNVTNAATAVTNTAVAPTNKALAPAQP